MFVCLQVFSVVATILERNPELKFLHVLNLDQIFRDAFKMFLKVSHSGFSSYKHWTCWKGGTFTHQWDIIIIIIIIIIVVVIIIITHILNIITLVHWFVTLKVKYHHFVWQDHGREWTEDASSFYNASHVVVSSYLARAVVNFMLTGDMRSEIGEGLTCKVS